MQWTEMRAGTEKGEASNNEYSDSIIIWSLTATPDVMGDICKGTVQSTSWIESPAQISDTIFT